MQKEGAVMGELFEGSRDAFIADVAVRMERFALQTRALEQRLDVAEARLSDTSTESETPGLEMPIEEMRSRVRSASTDVAAMASAFGFQDGTYCEVFDLRRCIDDLRAHVSALEGQLAEHIRREESIEDALVKMKSTEPQAGMSFGDKLFLVVMAGCALVFFLLRAT